MMIDPIPLGLRRSFGFGDRLGRATPGHLAAVRGSTFTPILAQQSIREMQRTDRTPEAVMGCARDAIRAAEYEGVWGADGDHLQTPADIAAVAAAGFCFFTIDPSNHVACDAAAIPEDDLESRIAGMGRAIEPGHAEDLYLGKTFALAHGIELTFDDVVTLRRAVVKYGAALQHAAVMAAAIAATMGQKPFELELSVDETDTPTTPLEHLFIGLELQRLGVTVISLAPRFVGDFEKGIDYRGDHAEFAEHYRIHAAIARHCGPYKLSIHSGSDKFGVYPIMGRISGEHIHVKTAGTSYLEALRVVCRTEPSLFHEIVAFSRGGFETDRATYHISGRLDQVPAEPTATEWERAYLDEDAGRQILHVTYGSVLTDGVAADGTSFRDALLRVLDRNDGLHCELVAKHLGRHIELLES
jgi:tagaturonate epimerase